MRLPKLLLIYFFLANLMLVGFIVSTKTATAQTVSEIDVWGDQLTDEAFGAQQLAEIGLGNNDPRLIVVRIIQIALGLLGIIAVVIMMYGGYMWMTANGDEEKVTKAKEVLRNGTIGLLIILSAFALATFIINRLLYSTGARNAGLVDSGQGGVGLGALGSGIVRSVYPAPGQTDVPRNTAIVVSFREAIDPATICDQVANNLCVPGTKILPDSIEIFKSKMGSGNDNVTDVLVSSIDNKTFVFKPTQLLGSQTEPIDYTVALTNDIEKANGDKAFRFGGFDWSFEVSTVVDLTPPQVASIFPGSDDVQDGQGAATSATQAKGSIRVTALPQTARDNSVSYIKTNPNSVALDIPNPQSNTCNGTVDISINNASPLTANVSYNMAGFVDTPNLNILGEEILIACGLRIKFSVGYQAGHSWQLTLQTSQNADFLMVAGQRYTFVDTAPQAQEIEIDSNLSTLAQRIRTALANQIQLSVAISPLDDQLIIITAVSAGVAGNSLGLQTSNKTTLIITPMTGGADKKLQTIVNGLADKPKNAIIQINFNEAMNPVTLSGTAEQLADYIRVVNLQDNKIIAGTFVLSNQYRTVEFIPDLKCGVNACGEPVYCLPGNTNIRVDILAASLAAVCTADADCVTYFPFSTCNNGLCYDNLTNANYPQGQTASGVFDLADNSLDGNKNGQAEGPVSFYNVNVNDLTKGDNYQWSFWISDLLDLSVPKILSTNIAPQQIGVHPGQVIEAHFNKLMMSSSINTGALIITQNNKSVTHKLMNVWALNGRALGYWTTQQTVETSTPADNEPDETIAQLHHANFSDSSRYRVHYGSGLKDIYQNCYKPSGSLSCPASNLQPTCCDDNPLAGNSCP